MPRSKGFRHSEATKEKMRLKAIGRKHSDKIKSKLSMLAKIRFINNPRPFAGNPFGHGSSHDLETRKKISKKLTGLKRPFKKRPYASGAKSHFWRGGKSSINDLIKQSHEYKLWRKSVFEKDSYECVSCKTRGGKLEADHIKPFADYPELRFSIENGRTLCQDCHKSTDTWGSRTLWKRYKR